MNMELLYMSKIALFIKVKNVDIIISISCHDCMIIVIVLFIVLAHACMPKFEFNLL